MSLLIPGEAKFSMGVSPNVVTATPGQDKIDMSLDDLIKSRRDELKATPRHRSTRRRDDPKKSMSTLRQAAQNSSRRVEGSRQAKRQAASSFRRGMRDSKAPTKMEVDKEIKKSTEKGKLRKKSLLLKSRGLTNKRAVRPRPPTKKAVKAAVYAMSDAGFKVPDGMKVVINLEKDESKSATTVKRNNNRGPVSKKRANGNNPNRNNGGRLWGKNN